MDWKDNHDLECKYLSRRDVQMYITSLPADMNLLIRMVFRLALQFKYKPYLRKTAYELHDGQEVKLTDLRCLQNNTAFSSFAEFFVKRQIYEDKDELIWLCGYIMANAIEVNRNYFDNYYSHEEIQEYNEEAIAGAICVEVSFFAYSCRPNAIRNFVGGKVQVRAVDQIDTLKQQITLAPIARLLTRQMRKQEISEIFQFNCVCSRCESITVDDDLVNEYNAMLNMVNALVLGNNYIEAINTAWAGHLVAQQIFGEYSEYGTAALVIARDTLLNMRHSQHQSEVTGEDYFELYNELRKNVLVTRGVNVKAYAKLVYEADSIITWCVNRTPENKYD